LLDGHFLMSWQDWAANFCYLILAVSYLVSDLYWLRVLAIVSLGLEGVYFYFGSTPPLWVGIGWAVVFVSINLVQLTLMTRERLTVRLSEREQLLHRGLFPDLTAVQFHRLLKIGAWRELDGGALLAVQGQPVPELLLIASGTVKVVVGTEIVALQQAGSFVGEMSFVSGENASATVAAADRVVLFAAAKPALDRLLAQDKDVKAALLRVIGHALTEKLKARHPSVDADEHAR
jgi:Cyclic nucleotide-binding domain